MRKNYFLLLLSLAIGGQGYAQKSIEVKNTTNRIRTEIISLPYDDFTRHFGVDSIFQVTDADGIERIHQLEKMGEASPINVLVQVTVAAKGTVNLLVSNKKGSTVPTKTYARYIPERFDDFAWENDRVAFRMYGKALEGRADDAQGMDYWAKRTDKLVIDRWYKENDYHKDHGEGMDYYSVGQTLGAGDMAFYYNNEVQYPKHYRGYKILDNGPIRTTFRLKFHTEEIDGNPISFHKTISLDAGSDFNKITLAIENQNNARTPIVLGIAKRHEDAPEYVLSNKNRTLAYWEPEINNSGRTGIALILSPNRKATFIADEPTQFLLHTDVEKSYTYYNGAAWDRAGYFTDATSWFDAVKHKTEDIQKPLKVTLKK